MKRQKKYNIYCGDSQTEKQTDVLLLEEEKEENKLVLYNDDVNKGKCTVKTGDMETLMPMHQKLLGRGLTSEII